jgi:hypothetical protein
MKKAIVIVPVLLAVVLLTGCSKQFEPGDIDYDAYENEKQAVLEQEKDIESNEVKEVERVDYSLYGPETNQITDVNEIIFNGEKIGSGTLVRDSAHELWVFTKQERTERGKTEETMVLQIDEDCRLHAIGFTNASCVTYMELEENKDVVYDGVNGPGVMVYGKVIDSGAIKVSDIMLQQ